MTASAGGRPQPGDPCWDCRLGCPFECGCACHDNDTAADTAARKNASRLLRAASLLIALAIAALAIAGCQSQSAPSSTPTSFWPCPTGQTFTQHHHIWGCWR